MAMPMYDDYYYFMFVCLCFAPSLSVCSRTFPGNARVRAPVRIDYNFRWLDAEEVGVDDGYSVAVLLSSSLLLLLQLLFAIAVRYYGSCCSLFDITDVY